MAQFKLYIRPAPELPPLPHNTPKPLVDAVENLRRWCRDVEQALRAVEKAINTIDGGTP